MGALTSVRTTIEGHTFTLPVERWSASMRMSWELPDRYMVTAELRLRLADQLAKGWTLAEEPRLVVAEDFLTLTDVYTLTAKMYRVPLPPEIQCWVDTGQL